MNLSLLSLSFECEFDELISVKKILAVINATYAVAKRKPEKNI